jgi:hypothetical protein
MVFKLPLASLNALESGAFLEATGKLKNEKRNVKMHCKIRHVNEP